MCFIRSNIKIYRACLKSCGGNFKESNNDWGGGFAQCGVLV